MKNEYKNMISHIQLPKGLNDKVLQASHEANQKAERYMPSRAEKRSSSWHRRAFKTAMCATCALALVLGSIHLVKPANGPASVPELTFGVVAYAADAGKIMEPQDSRIVFDLADSGVYDPEKGGFTGSLFKIVGDNIQTIRVSMDKGGLYRMKTVTVDRTTREGMAVLRALANGEDPQVEGVDVITALSEDEGEFRIDACWILGDSFSEEYDSPVSYGFWIPPELLGTDEDQDLQQAAHDYTDTLDGSNLTITVIFADGSEQTKTLHLHTGKLEVYYPDESSGPALTGKLAEGDAMYTYGIYADIEE